MGLWLVLLLLSKGGLGSMGLFLGLLSSKGLLQIGIDLLQSGMGLLGGLVLSLVLGSLLDDVGLVLGCDMGLLLSKDLLLLLLGKEGLSGGLSWQLLLGGLLVWAGILDWRWLMLGGLLALLKGRLLGKMGGLPWMLG
jgi:hypothetical protein